jgi:hypothetical protein
MSWGRAGLVAWIVAACALGLVSIDASASSPGQVLSRQVDDSLWNVHVQENRSALLIGNSKYPGKEKLPNPVRDVRSVGAKLSSLRFDVTIVEDADSWAMKRAIGAFAEKLKVRSGVALFLFSGHGGQVRGKNAMAGTDNIPVWVHDAIETMGVDLRLRIVMLDACRCKDKACKNPGFGDPQERPGNTFIAYSTEPGRPASDGPPGTNSPFVKSLLKHISTPDLDLEDFFAHVVDDTLEETKRWPKGPQRPTQFGNRGVAGKFYFRPQREATPVPAVEVCGPSNPKRCYDEGKARLKAGDLPSAIERFTVGCRHGHMTSCVRLGRHYHLGDGVKKHLGWAEGLYQRACQGRHSFGCLWLGRMTQRSDPKTAATYFSRVCHHGPPRYCKDLARVYLNGWGVPKEPARARFLYLRACNDGSLESCRILGVNYMTGRLWTKNLGEARRLLDKGCAGGGGDKFACQARARLQ